MNAEKDRIKTKNSILELYNFDFYIILISNLELYDFKVK